MSPKTPEFPFPSKRHRHHFRNHWLICIPRRLHASHSSIGGVGGPHADAKHYSSLILSHNSDPTWWPRLAHQHRYYFPDFPGKNVCPFPEWHVRLYDLKALSWLKICDSLTHVECKILFYDVLIAVLRVSASPGYIDRLQCRCPSCNTWSRCGLCRPHPKSNSMKWRSSLHFCVFHCLWLFFPATHIHLWICSGQDFQVCPEPYTDQKV